MSVWRCNDALQLRGQIQMQRLSQLRSGSNGKSSLLGVEEGVRLVDTWRLPDAGSEKLLPEQGVMLGAGTTSCGCCVDCVVAQLGLGREGRQRLTASRALNLPP